jgi:hypothetical protein
VCWVLRREFEILSRVDVIVGADKDEERALILVDTPFLGRIVIKHPRRIARPCIVDPMLVEEVNAIPEMNTKENRAPGTKVEEEKVKQEVAAREMVVTCECCFGDSPFETMIQREQGEHIFCPGCVEHYVQEQVFGKDKNIVQCMSSEGCNAGFSDVQLTRALTDKLLMTLGKHQQTYAEIAKANIAGLW